MSDNINNTNPPSEPLTREEEYLSAIAGVTSSDDIPEKPLTRVEKYLNKIVEDGGGSVYDKLEAGTNINIEETSDGKAKISASGEVSSEDTYARAEISAILDGASIDSFADVEAALADKVDKVSGKGLSANDFTNELKSKLDGIAAGAEVNVQSDWNQTTDTADDYIKNKPTLGTAAAKNATDTYSATGDDVTTGKAVAAALATLPEPMIFMGSLGTGGTIATLPTASSSNKGYVYKVITAGTYASQSAKVGDTFISDGSAWVLIPSGDEPSGTVTNVAVANGGGLTVSGSPITSSGTITVGHSNSVTAKTSSSLKKFTYDAYGHVTGSSELSTAESDALASGIDSTKVAQIETNKNNILSIQQSQENTNLWTYGNDSFTNYKQYGTEGVTMYPAGMYVLTGKFKSSGDGGIRLYVYNSNTNFYININSSDDEQSYLINSADYPIDRLFFRAPREGNYSGYTITLTDVKLTPKSNWYGYAYSNTTTWTILPYNNDEPIGETAIDELARKYALSYWRNKKINYNGDSITQGLMPDRTGYVKVVNQILNFGTVRNYAVGGTRLAHVEGEANCLIDRYTDMSLDADIVFIMANTNDYASQVPLGSADSVDTSTYNGALNVLLSWLKINYPTQPIIISTMLTRKIDYNGEQPLPITIEQYAQCVRDRASEHHVILYDAYKLSGMDLRTSPTDGNGITDDGLHPNRAGALALGRKIAAFINAQ